MTESSSAVKLVVKAPNQAVSDQVFEIQLGWTVKELKNYLCTAYPNKPIASEQRLIYSGHLLRDEQILHEVFQPIAGDSVTVHLVCSQKNSDDTPRTSSPNTTEQHTGQNIGHGAHQRSDQLGDGAFFNHYQHLNFANNPFEGQNASFPLVMTPEQMMQQMAVMQQMYAHYMAQYPSAAVGTSMADFSQMMMPPMVGNSGPHTQLPTDAAPGAAPVPVVAPQFPVIAVRAEQVQAQAPRINAGPAAGAADDDEDANRDWLDWFYWMSRAVVLFSIVYFYSSFSRFLLVIALTIFIYLYQIGWLFPRNEVLANDVPAAPARNRNQEAEVDPQHLQDMMDGNVNIDHRRRPAVARDSASSEPNTTDTTTERFSGLRLFWVIVSSLFTSLIPEQLPQNI